MRRRAFLRTATGALTVSAFGSRASGQPEPYRPLGDVPIANATEAVVGRDGETAFVAAMDGFVTVDVSDPENPTVLAERRDLLADHEDGPLRQIQDVKVETDRLVVVGPANATDAETLRGVLLYDVSDPASPERLAFHETDYPIHNAFVRDGVAYLTGNDGAENPLVIVDASDDGLEEVGRWSILDHDGDWGRVNWLLRVVHDVWVQDGLAYLVHWDAGTFVVDVSDPANPSYVADFGGRPIEALASLGNLDISDAVSRLPGNHHYAMVDDDASVLALGKEAWAADAGGGDGGPGGIDLWDVSDLQNPERLSTIDPPPTPDATIGGTWTTSHNFDLVGDRLFSSWYQGGVKIHDVSDPENPERLAWWRRPDETSFWTAKLATDSFFVGGSMGRNDDGRGGLYTFPNRAGEQDDPPSLAANESEATTEGSADARTPPNG